MANHERENSKTDQFIEQFGLRDRYERSTLDRVKDIVKIKKWEVECEIDWERFRELEPNPDGRYQEQLHVAALNLLEKVGVLSIEPENNYELLLKGIVCGYDGPCMGGVSFYFTRKEDAKAYAKVKWGEGGASIVHIPKGTKIKF